jgi:mannosyltransferase
MIDNKPEQRILGVSWSLLAILLLGTALRFLYLGRQSLWCDEAWSWLASRMSFGGIIRLSWEDNHPPLYYFLLKISLWMLPSSEFGLRVVSCISSIAGMTVMVRFVNRHWGHRAAVWVGLLVALSPSDIYYAQEARFYALLAFLYVLAYTQLVDALEGSRACLAGWVAANMCLAWTHAYGLLIVSLQVGFVLGYWAWHRLRGRPLAVKSQALLGAATVVLLACSPIIVLFWVIRTNKSAGCTIPTIHQLIDIVRWWTTGSVEAFPAFHIAWRMHDVSAVAMVGAALLGVYRFRKRGESFTWSLYLAAALMLALPLLVYGLSHVAKKPLWIDKGFLGCAHMLYLLAGVGLSAIGFRILRGLVFGAIVISMISGELYYYTKFEKSEAATVFHSFPPASPQRALLITNWRDEEPLYYLGSQVPMLYIEPTQPQQLLRVDWVDGQMPREIAAHCDDPQIRSATEIYAFGDASEIRTNRIHWPSCLQTKKIWVFEQSRWHPLDE